MYTPKDLEELENEVREDFEREILEAIAEAVNDTIDVLKIATQLVNLGYEAQEPVRIADDDTEASLHERIKAVERELFPATIKTLLKKMEGSEES